MKSTRRSLFLSFFLCSTLLFISEAKGQSNEQLLKDWNNIELGDDDRLEAAEELARNLLYSHPDSSRNIATAVLGMAIEHNLINHQIEAHTIIGGTYYVETAYIKALNHYMASLDIARESKVKASIASSHNNVGTVYDNLGDYPKALEHYLESLTIKLEIDDQAGLAVTYSNIGSVYSLQNKNEEALDYFSKSLAIDEKMDNKSGIASSNNNMGMVYSKLGNGAKAMEYYNKSLSLYQGLGDQIGEATALNNLGNLFNRAEEYSKAEDYFKRCLKLQEANNDKKGMSISQTNIGDVNIKFKKYDKAIEWCEKSYLISEQQQLTLQQFNACECLYLSHKRKGNEDYALAYMERMMMLNDQLSSDQTEDMLKKLEHTKELQMQKVKFRNDSLQKEEERLRTELEHKAEVEKTTKIRNYMMIGGLIVFIIAGGLFAQLRVVRKSRKIIRKERDRSDELLLNILPEEIAKELKEKGFAAAKNHDKVTILFTDFKEFTQTSEKLSATELVMEINACFEAFDRIMEKYNVEKIKTIGDAYMAAGGLPVPESGSVSHTVQAALEMQLFITERKAAMDADDKIAFEMRVGIHTGSAVAGIVGVKKFQYDIWGDTVNTAARMESSGKVGHVNISSDTYNIIKDDPMFEFEHRGKIEAKHKGAIDMYFVTFAPGYEPEIDITESKTELNPA
ncbi:MAG: tetratricopeptide repeat protein [Bacteroidia bacterium]